MKIACPPSSRMSVGITHKIRWRRQYSSNWVFPSLSLGLKSPLLHEEKRRRRKVVWSLHFPVLWLTLLSESSWKIKGSSGWTGNSPVPFPTLRSHSQKEPALLPKTNYDPSSSSISWSHFSLFNKRLIHLQKGFIPTGSLSWKLTYK